MIIRSGWGILIPFAYGIPFGIVFALFCVLTAQSNNPYLIQVGMILSAIIWFFSFYKLHHYRDNQPKKQLVDKETGQEFTYSKKNTLFFMGTKSWMYIFGAFSVMTILWWLVAGIAMIMSSGL